MCVVSRTVLENGCCGFTLQFALLLGQEHAVRVVTVLMLCVYDVFQGRQVRSLHGSAVRTGAGGIFVVGASFLLSEDFFNARRFVFIHSENGLCFKEQV